MTARGKGEWHQLLLPLVSGFVAAAAAALRRIRLTEKPHKFYNLSLALSLALLWATQQLTKLTFAMLPHSPPFIPSLSFLCSHSTFKESARRMMGRGKDRAETEQRICMSSNWFCICLVSNCHLIVPIRRTVSTAPQVCFLLR